MRRRDCSGWASTTLATALTFVVAEPVLAQSTITVTGVVRDFPASHVDFGIPALGTTGHYAASVALSLPADGRPMFSAGGFEVAKQWTERGGNNIAPHMFTLGGIGPGDGYNLVSNGRIRARNTSVIDSYDSSLGPYGGANVGSSALVATNSADPGMIVIDNSSTINGDLLIGPGGDPADVVDDQGGNGYTGSVSNLAQVFPVPAPTVPVGLPAYPATDILVGMNDSLTIDRSWHVRLFRLRRNATVTIDGDVTLICDDRWLVEQDARIIVPDGSSLTVYARTQVRLYGNNSVVNPDTANPDKVVLFVLGADPFNDQLVCNGTGTMFCGRVVAPDNRLDLDQGAEFFGTFWGYEVEINNKSAVHFDTKVYSEPQDVCGVALADTVGASGGSGSGGITDGTSFDEWFRDVLGVNQSAVHPLELVDNGTGIYEYSDAAFHPIDDRLLGNEGDVHNENFTLALRTTFVYAACAGQFVEVAGGDGLWIFIDGALVIDLGGVDHVQTQWIDVDRLGLTDGQVATMQLFYANRNGTDAGLTLRTNIPLISEQPPFSVSEVCD